MLTRDSGKYWRLAKALAFGSIAMLAAGCGSTIHIKDNLADIDTLSLDAKQRVVFTGARQAGNGERVMCTEPMPDAIVARAAVLAGSGNFSGPASGGTASGGGGLAGGTSESAASIGFRNETVQMLRDGYYRLCEAYLNGALTTEQYQDMITNADTFMVVISALQTLGTNPVAPAVYITTGNLNATTQGQGGSAAPSAGVSTSGAGGGIQTIGATPALPAGAKNAEMAAQIVSAYLRYRYLLAKQIVRREARHPRPQKNY